ncbi:MAG: hypothetical protein CBD74_09750 [Saprospirales bacterium TMED214]|nr:MAG: hypothetical protein CBD74_09750 [Saprospirales bacterium TMED214]
MDSKLARCVVDPSQKSFRLYSDLGEERVVECDTIDEFLSVLEVCRTNLGDDTLAYVNPTF